MSITYPTAYQTIPFLDQLPTVTATELKHSTADVLDQVSAGKAIAITRHDKTRAVLMSVQQYKELTHGQNDWLADLQVEYRVMLNDMQSPEQKESALRMFEATPEELGEAAVRGAERKSKEKL